MAVGACTLALAGVLATHANKSFSTYTGALYSTANVAHKFASTPSCLVNLSSIITTIKVTGATVATLFGTTLRGYKTAVGIVTLYN